MLLSVTLNPLHILPNCPIWAFPGGDRVALNRPSVTGMGVPVFYAS